MKKFLPSAFLVIFGFLLGKAYNSQKDLLSKIEIQAVARSEAYELLTGEKTKPVEKTLSSKEETCSSAEQKTAVDEKKEMQLLANIPSYKLRQIVWSRTKAYEAQVVDKKFQRNSENSEVLDLPTYYSLLGDVLKNNMVFYTESSLSLQEVQVPFKVILTFYDPTSENAGETLGAGTIKSIERVCWLAQAYFDIKNKKIAFSNSDCLPYISDHQYYIRLSTHQTGDTGQYVSDIFFSLPENSVSELLYLPRSQVEWQRGADLSWKAITTDERDELSGQFKDYQWGD